MSEQTRVGSDVGSRIKQIVGWVLGGGLLTIAVTGITFLQAPSAWEDFHRRMCGWWGPLAHVASYAGDCSPPAPKETLAPDLNAASREKISSAGYSLDGKGLIDAMSRGDYWEADFRRLGVRASREDLWRKFAAVKLGSPEYLKLVKWMEGSPSDHYARQVYDEIVETLRPRQGERALYNAVCTERASSQGQIWLQLGLKDKSTCSNRLVWASKVEDFMKLTGPHFGFDDRVARWWSYSRFEFPQ